jgi:hypothetical protein
MAAIDPSEYTVEAVKAWVTDNWHDHRNDSSFVSVHDAERDGKARVGLLDWLDHFAEEHEIDVTPLATGGPITLNPTTGVYGSAPILLTVTGTGFTAQSGITFDGGSKITTYVNATTVTTIVDWTLIKGAGSYVCWVVTDGVSTDPATFVVTAALPNPATTDDATLTRQLRAGGISGEPIRWYFTQYQAPITAIRAANTGYGTQATVQGVLDSTFPFNHLSAAAICVTPPGALTLSATAHDGRTRLLLDEDAQLPPENITWLVDGVVVAHGRDVDVDMLPPGEHQVRLDVAVGGNVYSKVATVGEPVPEPV